MNLGKAVFVWQIKSVHHGDAEKIANELAAAGFESALLHSVTLDSWRSQDRIALISALRNVGIHPIGSAAVYGVDPVHEGQQAAAFCKEFNLSAFVFDAEAKFDAVPSSSSAASKLLQAFRAAAPGVKAGWCWWPFYQSQSGRYIYHPKSVLWSAMHPDYGSADFGVPMVYWSWGNTPETAIRYFEESWRQWRLLTDKPLVPAGRAYVGDGGIPTPDAIAAFDARARELGAPGIAWWSMQHAFLLPEIWAALSNLKPFDQADEPALTEPAQPSTGLYMRALRFVNRRQLPSQSSPDMGDVQTGETIGPVIGVSGGKTGAWVRLANGHYVCVVDQFGTQYLTEA